MNKKTLKSIGAVIIGFAVVFILSSATDAVLEGIGVFPPVNKPQELLPWMLVIALIYRSAYTILGGYIAAALAPSKPMKHVIILGLIGLAFGTLGTVANWKLATESGTWYPILLLLLSFPAIYIGGKLRLRGGEKK